MFRLALIIVLLGSNFIFASIAIKNSTPLECTEVYVIHGQNVCIVNMHQETDLQAVQQRLRTEAYKFKDYDSEPTDAEEAMELNERSK